MDARWNGQAGRDPRARRGGGVLPADRAVEPDSAVLERAKRLVSKDFLEVLADIAPDALAQARAAGGLKDSEQGE
jgi:hypothetical protein